MVMYGRKHPRLNDGYYDRNKPSPYQNMDRYPSSNASANYGDRFSDRRDSPNFKRYRNDSPNTRDSRDSPRYANKSSYVERQKDRVERGSSGTPDRRQNAVYSDRGDDDRHSNHVDRNHRDKEPRKEKDKDVQKAALQTVGDWSEHISSSGKKYYYNCKTEFSQWEKPKEWLDLPSSSKDAEKCNNDKPLQTAPTNRATENRYKHSTSGSGGGHGNDRPYERNHKPSPSYTQTASSSSSRHPESGRQNSHDRYKNSSSMESRSSNQENNAQRPVSSHQSRTGTYADYSAHVPSQSSADYRKNTPPYSRGWSSKDQNGPADTNGNRIPTVISKPTHTSTENRRNENEDSRQMEDMDISPGSSPSNSQSNSRPLSRSTTPIVAASTPSSATPTCSVSKPTSSPGSGMNQQHLGAGVNALPQLISQLGEKALQNIDRQKLTEQALQTLQKLQQALLSRQTTLAQNTPGHSPRTSAVDVPSSSPYHPSVHQSPSVNSSYQKPVVSRLQPEEDSRGGRDSPRSEHSVRSSGRASPTPSHSSVQGVSVPSLSAVKSSTPQLAPSLANYYKEKLTEHVKGWQADHAERQANRYAEEAHNVGSLLCTKVSTELKKARSLVRVDEIQATIQEQRILFLRQQVLELEKGPSSFMSSNQTSSSTT
ncbi:WW domain-containing adapter protein with coiled-coil [Lingula anatina]|uniref:WW domain-containing adapter protein with coiled-coil n=1 Tax=Lingula anatina TaxID=7574 RepID=A0A1S3HNY8_LINAN|nr:WW domain-containing adapter protein with coiled-coil [Lingula anatina]|eukprot:XP_013387745.2 WW domain-containing adapter protein with coiled-coil [Lingula anatina]